MNWIHPTTGKTPKVVSLICLGDSSQKYLHASMEHNISDFVVNVDEVWTLNRGIGAIRHDLAFVMDHIEGEACKYPRYGEMLLNHDKPIITSDTNESWPGHIYRYPWGEIQAWLTEHIKCAHQDWWHNSVAFILAYAAFIGVKDLRVFGADYANHSSGVVEDGHPNVAYWAGVLERAGMAVRPVSGSSFLGANQRGWIYGYRFDPRNNNREEFLKIKNETTGVMFKSDIG